MQGISKKKDKMTMVRQSFQLIPLIDTDDQRILEFDWTRATSEPTQPKVVVSYAPSLDEYLYAKNLKYQLSFFRDFDNQRILQSDWLRAFSGITEKPDISRHAVCVESYKTLLWTILV